LKAKKITNGCIGCTVGKVYDVVVTRNGHIQYVNDEGEVSYSESDTWKLIAENKKENKKENGMEEWNFGVASKSQIDRELLDNTLSYNKPMLILFTDINVSGVEIRIHYSIWNKTMYCKNGKSLSKELLRLLNKNTVHVSSITKVKKCISKIKKAAYKKQYRQKINCKVILYEI